MADELPYVRCIECGKVLGHKWNRYKRMLSEGVEIKKALNELGLTRYCCRFRMMNPIKIPITARQTDPTETGLEKQMATLTVATGPPAPVVAPLQAMAQPQTQEGILRAGQLPSYTVIPIEVGLPEIPQVALPPIPEPGAEVAPEEFGNIIRVYQAW